ncbi:MAG TPA: biopolymer transporter ExbD [Planctomycetaceae bacterium]|nr:biopolymer transporter ExbD [Planctomycetaceae bacterium]
MSAALHSEDQADPNLTPILDMVFQLITFFMLVINFKAASLDMSLKLPVIGSARPVDTHGNEELLVLNVNQQGEIIIYGSVRDAESYLAREAELARAKLKAKGEKVAPGGELPIMVVVRADQSTPFELLNKVLTDCQKNGFRKFALRAMNREKEARS